MKIQIATKDDIPALDILVNSGYRGDSSKRGWTTEADLLDGLRTDKNALEKLMNEEGSVILKISDDEGAILGCVNLKEKASKLYLGMLTVNPLLQKAGIRKVIIESIGRKGF